MGTVTSFPLTTTTFSLAKESTDNAIVRFKDATGGTQNSSVTVDDDGVMAGASISGNDNTFSDVPISALPSVDEDDMASDSDTKVPTQQSVKAYSGKYRASYYGLSGSKTAAENRAILNSMAALNIPFDFDVVGTIEIDQPISLNSYTQTMAFNPNCIIQQTGTDANANVFNGTDSTGVRIYGGQFVPGTTTSSTFHGWAFYFANATDVWLEEIVVKNHRNGGIFFNGSNRCGWINPVARDSVVTNAENHQQHGTDFLVSGDTTDFVGKGGRSIDGCGVGFVVQSFAKGGASVMKRIAMTGWTVVRAPQYGAMAYRTYIDDEMTDIVLLGDLIDTVYGDVEIAGGTPGEYLYGGGVYIQGVNGATFGAKIIRNTNVYTNSEALGIAAISLNNATFGSAHADLIENANWYGVSGADPLGFGNPGNIGNGSLPGTDSASSPHVGLEVDVRVIRNSTKAALYKKNFPIMRAHDLQIINPKDRAVLTREQSTTAGRSINERIILDNVSIRGANTTTNLLDIAGHDVLEWSSGDALDNICGNVLGVSADCGGVKIGAVTIDATLASSFPFNFSVPTEEEMQVRCVGTGSISGTVFTVTGIDAGYYRPGDILSGDGVTANTVVTGYGTAVGGVGTYTVYPSQTASSTTVTAKKQYISKLSSDTDVIAKINGAATVGNLGNIKRKVRGIDKISTLNGGATASAYSGTEKMFNTLDDTGTPSVKNHKNWITGGTTSITGLLDMVNGEEVEIVAAHTVTFVHSGSFVMASGSNISATSGKRYRFMMQNGTIRQIG